MELCGPEGKWFRWYARITSENLHRFQQKDIINSAPTIGGFSAQDLDTVKDSAAKRVAVIKAKKLSQDDLSNL